MCVDRVKRFGEIGRRWCGFHRKRGNWMDHIEEPWAS